MTCRNISFYIWAGWISVIINTYHDSRVGRFEPTKYFHVIVMLYVYMCIDVTIVYHISSVFGDGTFTFLIRLKLLFRHS